MLQYIRGIGKSAMSDNANLTNLLFYQVHLKTDSSSSLLKILRIVYIKKRENVSLVVTRLVFLVILMYGQPSQYKYSFIGPYLCTVTTFQYNTHLVSISIQHFILLEIWRFFYLCTITTSQCTHCTGRFYVHYSVLVQPRHLQSFIRRML